jgi:subtilisin family serine protease
VNAIRVYDGSADLARELAQRDEVAEILAPRTYTIPKPTAGEVEQSVNAVEWGIAEINADDVWSTFGVRGEGIVVANIDTGVQFDHPALAGAYRGHNADGSVDHNYNWFDPSRVCGDPMASPCDNNGHGTHTMGTMVGDDGAGNHVGVAPGARWIAAKGCETNFCSDAALLAAGQWILAPTDLSGANPRPDLRPNIVNNSWGGDGQDPWYQDTVAAWRAAGIFPAFSNGNSGPSCNTAGSPGNYTNSYATGAFDVNGAIANFSSRGSGVGGGVKPDIAAPGVNVRSSVPGNGYAAFNGTSLASPHTAGTVALMWSAAPALRGNLDETATILDDTAADTSNVACGGTADDNNVWVRASSMRSPQCGRHRAALSAALPAPSPTPRARNRSAAPTSVSPAPTLATSRAALTARTAPTFRPATTPSQPRASATPTPPRRRPSRKAPPPRSTSR